MSSNLSGITNAPVAKWQTQQTLAVDVKSTNLSACGETHRVESLKVGETLMRNGDGNTETSRVIGSCRDVTGDT